ncbi:hypothetical protein ACHAWU_007200 [Discostella pseudostelligera]|uniref:Uncharacterized protein n=1 Tax=Discostella pseudostelligera TaxID=259834 RepID=A0ABD3LX02_9STRA
MNTPKETDNLAAETGMTLDGDGIPALETPTRLPDDEQQQGLLMPPAVAPIRASIEPLRPRSCRCHSIFNRPISRATMMKFQLNETTANDFNRRLPPLIPSDDAFSYMEDGAVSAPTRYVLPFRPYRLEDSKFRVVSNGNGDGGHDIIYDVSNAVPFTRRINLRPRMYPYDDDLVGES